MGKGSTHHSNDGATGRRRRPKFAGFVDCNPRQQDRQAIRELAAKSTVNELVFALVEDGAHKVSFQLNLDNDAINAQVYCRDVKSPNAGKVLSAMHADILTAVAILHHHHFVHADEGDWEVGWIQSEFDW